MEIIGLILLVVVLLIMAASSAGANPPSTPHAPAPHYPPPGYYPPAPFETAPYNAPPDRNPTALPILMFAACLALFVYFYQDLKNRMSGPQPLPSGLQEQRFSEELVPKPDPFSPNKTITPAAPKPRMYDADLDKPPKTLRTFEVPEEDDPPVEKIEFRRRTEMHALKLGVYSSREGVEMLKREFPGRKIEALFLDDGEYWACILFDAPADLRDALADWKTRRREWISYGIEPEPVNLHNVCAKVMQEKGTGLCVCFY
jgi:hypothetical protein